MCQSFHFQAPNQTQVFLGEVTGVVERVFLMLFDDQLFVIHSLIIIVAAVGGGVTEQLLIAPAMAV